VSERGPGIRRGRINGVDDCGNDAAARHFSRVGRIFSWRNPGMPSQTTRNYVTRDSQSIRLPPEEQADPKKLRLELKGIFKRVFNSAIFG